MLSRKEEFKLRYRWLIVLVALLLASSVLFYFGATIELAARQDAIRAVINSLAGAVLTIAVIDVFHEFFVARDVRHQFKILDDFRNNGVERVCTQREINAFGREQLSRAKSFKGIGMGFQWLLDDNADSISRNFQEFRRVVASQKNDDYVLVLVPDPCREQLKARYKDEPNDSGYKFELGLEGVARTIRQWWEYQNEFDGRLRVRIYHTYPMANVNIYDDYVFVSAVLFKRRAKDGFTVVYRRGSRGAKIYEDHVAKVELEGSRALDEAYMTELEVRYPHGAIRDP